MMPGYRSNSCISAFSATEWDDYFERFRRPIAAYTQRRSGQVKVAVLDTGVDESMLCKGFGKSIIRKKSFLDGQDGQDTHDHDEVRHGTHIVNRLLYLVPWIHVYVARVKKDGQSQLEPTCVAEVSHR